MRLRTIVLALAFVLVGTLAHAQAVAQAPGATPVQQFPPFQPCDTVGTAVGAGNTTVAPSVAAQTGRSFYLCTVDINEIANAAVTGAAGPAEVCATTGLVTNMTWMGSNATMTVGQLFPVIQISWGPTPLRVPQNTAFSVSCTGGQASYTVRVNFTGFYY